MARVGVVGLGIMGSAIARHVLAGGHTLVGHDIRTEGVEELRRVGGTQDKYTVFIENCHVHVARVLAAITGGATPTADVPEAVVAQPES